MKVLMMSSRMKKIDDSNEPKLYLHGSFSRIASTPIPGFFCPYVGHREALPTCTDRSKCKKHFDINWNATSVRKVKFLHFYTFSDTLFDTTVA